MGKRQRAHCRNLEFPEPDGLSSTTEVSSMAGLQVVDLRGAGLRGGVHESSALWGVGASWRALRQEAREEAVMVAPETDRQMERHEET